ncbi:MAG: copper amine oxidase N-terminal domain-containing protein [Carboxydocellales bacterium]
MKNSKTLTLSKFRPKVVFNLIAVVLTTALVMLNLGITSSWAYHPIAVGSDGWIRQNDQNTPPDKITTMPVLPPGFKGTWVNPALKDTVNDKIYIEVNGSSLFPDVDPYLDENNRTMVPVRFIAEALNSKVAWDASDNQGRVEITRKNKVIQLWLGLNQAKVDGQELIMDTTAKLINNRTMVPIRFVAEAFGAEVLWSEGNKKVYITLNK